VATLVAIESQFSVATNVSSMFWNLILWRVCSIFAARKVATNITFCGAIRRSSQETFSYGSTCHGAIVATKGH